MYIRDGSFTLDEQGNLLTSDGNRVLGYSLLMMIIQIRILINP